jgi:Arc/MetJ-type ribon-helix-helix transcriptional regulator
MNTVSRHLAAEDRYDAMPYRRCGRSGLAPGEGPTFPFWYRFGMSKQIAVRLDDDLVAFVDEIVQSGRERSRAAVVTRALERERRRIVAARDAEILARTGPDSELAGLAEHAVGRPIDG